MRSLSPVCGRTPTEGLASLVPSWIMNRSIDYAQAEKNGDVKCSGVGHRVSVFFFVAFYIRPLIFFFLVNLEA